MLDKLPREILIAIFGFLNLCDLKAVRLTCKNAYYTSLTKILIHNEWIKIDTRILKPEGKSIIKCLKTGSRPFYHIAVHNVNLYNYIWFFEKYAPYIKSIILKLCPLNSYLFTLILMRLQSLEKLQMINCDMLLIEGDIYLTEMLEPNIYLRHLQTLEITTTKYLTDQALYRFIQLFPNVKYLSFAETTINCHDGTFHFNYNHSRDLLRRPSANVFTVHFLIEIINVKCQNILGLNFENTLINNRALEQLLRIENLQLNYLNLNSCRELEAGDFLFTGNWQRALSELQVASCELVTNEFLEMISEHSPNLNILNISGNDNITDIGLLYLEFLEKIIQFDISNCCNISGVAISNLIKSRNWIGSIKIVKANHTALQDHDVMNIIHVINFYELEISYCNQLTDRFLNILFYKQKSLKKLDMSGNMISDSGIAGLPSERLWVPKLIFKNLIHNPISQISLQNDIMEDITFYFTLMSSYGSKPLFSLQDLMNLQVLKLNNCRLISDFLFGVPYKLFNLKELYILGNQITNRAVYLLVHNFPSLELLNISGNEIDDNGVYVIVRNLHHLKHLFIQNTRISNMSLRYMLDYCKKLQTLNIQGCSNMDEKLINRIKRMPNMVEVIGTPNQNYAIGRRIPVAPPPPMSC